jgi:hypothetical protein
MYHLELTPKSYELISENNYDYLVLMPESFEVIKHIPYKQFVMFKTLYFKYLKNILFESSGYG